MEKKFCRNLRKKSQHKLVNNTMTKRRPPTKNKFHASFECNVDETNFQQHKILKNINGKLHFLCSELFTTNPVFFNSLTTRSSRSCLFIIKPFHILKIKVDEIAQNGQTHSENSSAVADELFECVRPFCKVGA